MFTILDPLISTFFGNLIIFLFSIGLFGLIYKFIRKFI